MAIHCKGICVGPVILRGEVYTPPLARWDRWERHHHYWDRDVMLALLRGWVSVPIPGRPMGWRLWKEAPRRPAWGLWKDVMSDG